MSVASLDKLPHQTVKPNLLSVSYETESDKNHPCTEIHKDAVYRLFLVQGRAQVQAQASHLGKFFPNIDFTSPGVNAETHSFHLHF